MYSNMHPKRVNQKTAETIGKSIGNRIGDQITSLNTSSEYNSETIKNEAENIPFDKEIVNERYISQEKI